MHEYQPQPRMGAQHVAENQFGCGHCGLHRVTEQVCEVVRAQPGVGGRARVQQHRQAGVLQPTPQRGQPGVVQGQRAATGRAHPPGDHPGPPVDLGKCDLRLVQGQIGKHFEFRVPADPVEKAVVHGTDPRGGLPRPPALPEEGRRDRHPTPVHPDRAQPAT